jgi:hypothetical protein
VKAEFLMTKADVASRGFACRKNAGGGPLRGIHHIHKYFLKSYL